MHKVSSLAAPLVASVIQVGNFLWLLRPYGPATWQVGIEIEAPPQLSPPQIGGRISGVESSACCAD